VVLLFVVYQLWGTGFAEAASQAKLKKQFNAAPAATSVGSTNTGTSGTTGSGDASTVGGASGVPAAGPPEGSAIAYLNIPKISVQKYVVEGVADADLSEGPGHYPGTPMPGQPGNVAIAGHRTTYGAPFYDLNELQPGDKIFLTAYAGATQHTFLYVVDHSEVVKPTDVAVIAPTTDNELTLTTCNPRYEATTRLIVVAKLAGIPVTPPSTVVAPVEVRANLGTGQRSAWPATLAFGAIAVGLWVLVRLWALRRRYWRWIPFLVGIPVCSVPLWFLFQNVIKLLPNNI
jgi:sortase A